MPRHPAGAEDADRLMVVCVLPAAPGPMGGFFVLTPASGALPFKPRFNVALSKSFARPQLRFSSGSLIGDQSKVQDLKIAPILEVMITWLSSVVDDDLTICPRR
jgi:hypothetical protein